MQQKTITHNRLFPLVQTLTPTTTRIIGTMTGTQRTLVTMKMMKMSPATAAAVFSTPGLVHIKNIHHTM